MSISQYIKKINRVLQDEIQNKLSAVIDVFKPESKKHFKNLDQHQQD